MERLLSAFSNAKSPSKAPETKVNPRLSPVRSTKKTPGMAFGGAKSSTRETNSKEERKKTGLNESFEIIDLTPGKVTLQRGISERNVISPKKISLIPQDDSIQRAVSSQDEEGRRSPTKNLSVFSKERALSPPKPISLKMNGKQSSMLKNATQGS